jgi:hypothetical protein
MGRLNRRGDCGSPRGRAWSAGGRCVRAYTPWLKLHHGNGAEDSVRPENLKHFINLTFSAFLLMLDQWTPPSSNTSW